MRAHGVTTKFGIAAGALTACVALVVACGDVGAVTVLSVGNTANDDGGAGDLDSSLVAADPDATSTGTLMDQLNAKCAAEPGQADSFSSAADLTSKINGRWYHCASGDADDWNLPRGTAVVFDFTTTGTWAFLDYVDASQTFAVSADAASSGQVLYLVFAGTTPEGGPIADGSAPTDGGGYMSMPIPFNDAVPRNGIFLELESPSANAREFQVVLQQNPRKLQILEIATNGNTSGVVSATFVPVD